MNGYFEKPFPSFEAFVLSTLKPCTCFNSCCNLMHSVQCQASGTTLTPTGEHKMIDKEMEIFKIVGSQLLQNFFTANDKAAKIKLRTCLAGLFCGISTIATSADPHHHRFAARLEHRVSLDTICKPHYSDFAVKQFLPSSSDNNEGCASNNEKLCILV